jgi:NAD(P)H-dependent flavin oxidoreductase YrpB (nitropropane dioxygenase family)
LIHTPVCELLRIRHPVVLGGMAGSTSVPLVAAVSNAGGLGTLGIARTLATKESPLHPNLKQAVLDSDGHDTVLTEIPDVARANVWPGAMARSRRNAFVERWAGREWELRARQPEAAAALQRAVEAGDADHAALLIGQDAGLIHDLPPAGELVERIVAEAEALLKDRLPGLVRVA